MFRFSRYLDAYCSWLGSCASLSSFYCPVSSWVIIISWCRLHHHPCLLFYLFFFGFFTWGFMTFILPVCLFWSHFCSLRFHSYLFLFIFLACTATCTRLVAIDPTLMLSFIGTDRPQTTTPSVQIVIRSSMPRFLLLGLGEHTCVFYIQSVAFVLGRAWY